MNVLVIDNYDSFTFNLYQYLIELGANVNVFRNDEITLGQIRMQNYSHIVISPGPGTPDTAGITLEILKNLSGEIPILGVCLGHQAIGQVFGGKIVRASKLMHG
jgi:anthranilate synthase/aminodeoxychorismate synthase-like glutamine amidotransferase